MVYQPKPDAQGLKDYQDQPLVDTGGPIPGLGGAAVAAGGSREDALRLNENFTQGLATGNGFTPGAGAPNEGVSKMGPMNTATGPVDMTGDVLSQGAANSAGGSSDSSSSSSDDDKPTGTSLTGARNRDQSYCSVCGEPITGDLADTARNPKSVWLDGHGEEGDGEHDHWPEEQEFSAIMAGRKNAWTGWGPAQFPRRHKVAGWDWDSHLNGYVTTSHRKFACDCGEEHDVPGYGQCKCGKLWNRYAIGSGPDHRTASPEIFIAREIPVLEATQEANRLMSASRQRVARTLQDDIAEDLADGYADMPEAEAYARWNNRWRDMRQNAEGLYRPKRTVHQWRDFYPPPEGTWNGQVKGASVDEILGAAWHQTQGPWSGKTPAGPQGPGVGGLKQKTRYKGVSTPALRQMRQQLMTSPQQGIDMNELLRELSFREVLGALHDLTEPGGTVDSDGRKTKRTNPNMSAADDWHHRDRGGRWTRGDGHG